MVLGVEGNKYFSYPLPDLIAGLRESLYLHLAPVTYRWNEAMRIDVCSRKSTLPRGARPGFRLR
jgi:hypothetical protein